MKQVIKYLMIAVSLIAVISAFGEALKAGLEKVQLIFPDMFKDLEQSEKTVEKQAAASAPVSKPHFETTNSESEV